MAGRDDPEMRRIDLFRAAQHQTAAVRRAVDHKPVLEKHLMPRIVSDLERSVRLRFRIPGRRFIRRLQSGDAADGAAAASAS